MSAPRLYCPQLHVGEVVLAETEARHALRSRRLRPGDAVALFDGRGGFAHALLPVDVPNVHTKSSKRRRSSGPVTVSVSAVGHVPASRRTLTLIVAGCKGPRLDWLVEKCTELDATRLVFADFARSVAHIGQRHADKLSRTAIEACKQCGRLWLPQIKTGNDLAATVAQNADQALLVAHPNDQAVVLGVWLQHHAAAVSQVAAVIGPEGGLEGKELEMLQDAGGQLVSLGKHTLRVETAAVAVAAGWAAAPRQEP